MKAILQSILLMVWMILTVVLAISFIGLMILDMADGTNIWFNFPSKILNR